MARFSAILFVIVTLVAFTFNGVSNVAGQGKRTKDSMRCIALCQSKYDANLAQCRQGSKGCKESAGWGMQQCVKRCDRAVGIFKKSRK
jgi:hypothetical protein